MRDSLCEAHRCAVSETARIRHTHTHSRFFFHTRGGGASVIYGQVLRARARLSSFADKITQAFAMNFGRTGYTRRTARLFNYSLYFNHVALRCGFSGPCAPVPTSSKISLIAAKMRTERYSKRLAYMYVCILWRWIVSSHLSPVGRHANICVCTKLRHDRVTAAAAAPRPPSLFSS